MTIRVSALVATLALGAAVSLSADVKTQERTLVKFEGALGRVINFFGGRGAREGIVNTVAVKGDRMMSTTDSTGEIVDLAEEKVYTLDLKKKSYTVQTFAEMRQRMEEAMAKAKADAAKAEGKPAPKSGEQAPEYEVDFSVKQTGQSKQIAGFDTRESVATISVREKGKALEDGGMVLESSLWLAPDVPALKELNDFRARYAEKLFGPLMAQAAPNMAQAMAMYPMMKDAMEKMAAESRKMQGTPLSTVMTFQLLGQPQTTEAEPQRGNDAPPTNVGGLLGGLGRRMARKKNDDAPAAAPGTPGRVTIMTTTSETLQVSSSATAADVALPAGFQQKR